MSLLKVRVPENAVVFIDEYKTNSKGTQRSYVRNKLTEGQMVRWRVRAEVTKNGRKVQQAKEIGVRAGAMASLVFDFRPVETKLTLRVPADAKVYLGPYERRGGGTIREFKASKLVLGQSVSDYPVRVSVIRDGRVLTQEQRITLTGGESRTISFRFDRQTTVSLVK